jgi:dTDP-4-dehydrorhamnose 3,5-epimerase
MVSIRQLGLEGVLEIVPSKHGDSRGFFSETWNESVLSKAGIELEFVQDNHSLSAAAGTLRGLHFQTPPRAQGKLVRVLQGAIFDVVVDIRKDSPSFGHWEGIEVSREKWNQILVPVGYAHGFVTLEPETEVIYKVTDFYSAENDRVIRFDDPAIGISWPAEFAPYHLSPKDKAAPPLSAVDTSFVMKGGRRA